MTAMPRLEAASVGLRRYTISAILALIFNRVLDLQHQAKALPRRQMMTLLAPPLLVVLLLWMRWEI
jgi:hypothetical protein